MHHLCICNLCFNPNNMILKMVETFISINKSFYKAMRHMRITECSTFSAGMQHFTISCIPNYLIFKSQLESAFQLQQRDKVFIVSKQFLQVYCLLLNMIKISSQNMIYSFIIQIFLFCPVIIPKFFNQLSFHHITKTFISINA